MVTLTINIYLVIQTRHKRHIWESGINFDLCYEDQTDTIVSYGSLKTGHLVPSPYLTNEETEA